MIFITKIWNNRWKVTKYTKEKMWQNLVVMYQSDMDNYLQWAMIETIDNNINLSIISNRMKNEKNAEKLTRKRYKFEHGSK